MKKTSFNQRFRQYEGNNVRGSTVNAMIDTIIQNNLTNQGDTSKQIIIENEGAAWNGDDDYVNTAAPRSTVGAALTGRSYKVECFADSYSGYINRVKITDAT